MNNKYELREIKIEVTNQCSLACIHCSSDATPASSFEMDPKDCLRILEEAIKTSVDHVAFTGGEPLLWEALEEAVILTATNISNISIYTSGNVPSFREKIRGLSKNGLRTCIFSIFGSTEDSHEQITRIKGSYQETLNAIQDASKCGLRVELHFVPLSSNYFELEKIAERAKTWGVSCISVLRFVPQGRGSLMRRQLLNKLQNIQLKNSIERLREQGYEIRTGSPYNFLMLNDQPKCSAGIDRLIIGPDLRIYPCDAFKQIKAEEVIGTSQYSILKSHTLAECWNRSPYLTTVREHLMIQYSEPCLSCSALGKCISGCLAQKVIECGNIEARPDPMCLMT